MGIKQLVKIIEEFAPAAVSERPGPEFYHGQKVAIDASTALYQFLIAVRTGDGGGVLTDASGEVTSHLIGFLYRTSRMMQLGLRPVFVFDGKPPEMKRGELDKRRELRDKAQVELEKAKEAGDAEVQERMEKRTTKVTRQHSEEAKRLLTALGYATETRVTISLRGKPHLTPRVPWVEAPCEAEAQCARMAKDGVVSAAASSDMDTLCFGAPILITNLDASKTQQQTKRKVKEYRLDQVLAGLGLTMDAFVDFCILSGCDYTSTVRGLGPKSALEYIRAEGSLEAVVERLRTVRVQSGANAGKCKYVIPDPFPFEQARQLFKQHETVEVPASALRFRKPDRDSLVSFLVTERQFAEKSVLTAADKIEAALGKRPQMRMTDFFQRAPKPVPTTSGAGKKGKGGKAAKRKAGAQAGCKQKRRN